MTRPIGILDKAIEEMPIAVVDVETTGLYPGGDRVIELGVVRVDPGGKPEVVLDTLIDPGRHVTATEIHGITDQDVDGAPRFSEIGPLFLQAISGCVFAAYNVYFDAKFLQAELSTIGVTDFPPYLCLMYMRPMLGIGSKCTLGDACKQHHVGASGQHVAADDALASSQLWLKYLELMTEANVRTFRDLSRLRSYKFTSSFHFEPISIGGTQSASVRLKSRRAAPVSSGPRSTDRADAAGEYWEALKSSLADLQLSNEEIAYLKDKKRELDLEDDVMRWLHARAFAGILSDMSEDYRIDDAEVDVLECVANGLRQLGWSPGDAAGESVAAARAKTSETPRGFFGRFRR